MTRKEGVDEGVLHAVEINKSSASRLNSLVRFLGQTRAQSREYDEIRAREVTQRRERGNQLPSSKVCMVRKVPAAVDGAVRKLFANAFRLTG